MVAPRTTELALLILFGNIHATKVLLLETHEDPEVVCEIDGYLVAADGSGNVVQKPGKSEHLLLPNPLPFGVLVDYERMRRSV